MPLFQYFGWVGSFLLAALLAANWCFPAPVAPQSDVPLDQKISIRIHTDHKWPERVVLDTTSTLARCEAERDGVAEANACGGAQPFEAFAEMAPPRPCFRPPAPRVRRSLAVEKARLSYGAQGLTFPNPLHKLPGKS